MTSSRPDDGLRCRQGIKPPLTQSVKQHAVSVLIQCAQWWTERKSGTRIDKWEENPLVASYDMSGIECLEHPYKCSPCLDTSTFPVDLMGAEAGGLIKTCRDKQMYICLSGSVPIHNVQYFCPVSCYHKTRIRSKQMADLYDMIYSVLALDNLTAFAQTHPLWGMTVLETCFQGVWETGKSPGIHLSTSAKVQDFQNTSCLHPGKF